MSTVTVSKREYWDLKKRQDEMVVELSTLRAAVLDFTRDELRPEVVRRLSQQSALLDRGKSKKFSNWRDFKRYLQGL